MKIGIAIAAWKKSIFTRHLTEAGYASDEQVHKIAGSLLLTVETNDMRGLARAVAAANAEAGKHGPPEIRN